MLQGEAEAKAGEGAEKKAPEEDYYIYANVLLNWGNILYERSQLAARAGQVRGLGPNSRSELRLRLQGVGSLACRCCGSRLNAIITAAGCWQ